MCNYFFSNGFVSLICIINLLKNSPDLTKLNNTLIIEENTDKGVEHHQIMRIIIESYTQLFDNIIFVKTPYYEVSITKPLKSFQNINIYKKIISTYLPSEVTHLKSIYAPLTSKLWPFYYDNSYFFLIEHGLGEYIYSNVRSNFRDRIKNIFFSLCNYKDVGISNGIFLSLKKFKDPESFHNNITVYNEVARFFWIDFQKSNPTDYLKIFSLIDNSSGGINILYYLPSDEIEFENYHIFLQRQISKLTLNQRINTVVIKKHPGDIKSSYAQLLKKYFDNVIELDNLLSYIPIEFYAYLSQNSTFLGSHSTSLYYIEEYFKHANVIRHHDFHYDLYKITERKNMKKLNRFLSKHRKDNLS